MSVDSNYQVKEIAKLKAYLDASRSTIKELKQWKDEAMEVMPDFQEIGRLLNMKLGDSVHDKIVSGIKELKSENERLKLRDDAIHTEWAENTERDAEVLELLREVEWEVLGEDRIACCVSCGAMNEYREHNHDCKLNAVIGKMEGGQGSGLSSSDLFGRWIPIDEQLPEDGDWVLHSYYGVKMPTYGRHHKGQFFREGGPVSQPATHWLGVPIIPEQNEGGLYLEAANKRIDAAVKAGKELRDENEQLKGKLIVADKQADIGFSRHSDLAEVFRKERAEVLELLGTGFVGNMAHGSCWSCNGNGVHTDDCKLNAMIGKLEGGQG